MQFSIKNGGHSLSGENVSKNFVKIFNELYLFSMDFALYRTLEFRASLIDGCFRDSGFEGLF
jgi:hypothetical protein